LKKIAILAFSDKYIGGVYQYTQSLIDALKEDKSREYIIFCNSDDNRFDRYGLEVRKVDKPKMTKFVKIVRAFQFLLFIRKSWFFTKEEIDKFSDIDLFLSSSISAYPHFYIAKPFVFTLHDMQERYHPEFFSKYERLSRWLNNRTLARTANKIICESTFVKNDIVKFTGIRGDKVLIIQSPPPENFLNYKFKRDRFEIVKKKYNLPDNYIFYPAQCWFHKNHIKMLEAFEIICKKYDDVGLILAGSKQKNYNNLIKRIDELNLNDRAKHLGYIDYEDLPYLYKMSCFLMMPSLFESVSIPIYEAFAMEVAVCSSNVVALPEQVGDAGIIFNPYDLNDMVEKMDLYLKNQNLRQEKASLGLKKVANFNHDAYKNKLLTVLK
jgi:glycosyltransferase involved in cell wall biosynthesis